MSSFDDLAEPLRRRRNDAVDALEKFYESRVARLDEERDALLAPIARCANSREEGHWLEWVENTLAATEESIDDDMRELEAQLAERKRDCARLQKGLAGLREASLGNRKRVQRLLALSQPIQSYDTTFVYRRAERGIDTELAEQTTPLPLDELLGSVEAAPASPEIAASLRSSVGALRQFLERYKEVTRSAVMELCSEREAHAIRRGHIVGVVEKLAEALKKRDDNLQKDLREATASYLRLRHDAKVYSASAREERTRARQRVRDATRRIEVVRAQMTHETEKAREAGDRRLREATSPAQVTLNGEDKALQAAREMSKHFHAQHRSKMSALRKECKALKKDIRTTEKKRAKLVRKLREDLSEARRRVGRLRTTVTGAMQVATLPSEGLGLGGQSDSTATCGPPVKYFDLSSDRDALLRAAYAAPRSRRRENRDPNERGGAEVGRGRREVGRLRPWRADVGTEDWYNDPGNIFVPYKVFESVAGEVLELSDRLEQLRVASRDGAAGRKARKDSRAAAELDSAAKKADRDEEAPVSEEPIKTGEDAGETVADVKRTEKGEEEPERNYGAGPGPEVPEKKEEMKGDDLESSEAPTGEDPVLDVPVDVEPQSDTVDNPSSDDDLLTSWRHMMPDTDEDE